MKKFASILLTLVMILSLTGSIFAAETYTIYLQGNSDIATFALTTARTYDVYQIFIGDVEGETLSNVKWGANGTGTGAVDAAVLTELTALTQASDTAKLDAITKYVDFKKAAYSSIAVGGSLSGVPAGYYLLKDTTTLPDGQEYGTHLVMVVGDTTIKPKVGEVESEKKVKDINDTEGTLSDWQDSADHDITDTVSFQLSGTVSDNYANFETYYYCFHDTLSAGLTFNPESVKVYVVNVNEAGETVTTDVAAEQYTVVTTGLTDGCTFEVEFTDLKEISAVNADSKIYVEYTATLNENAVLGSAGNPNTMYLEYSNNPNVSGEGESDDNTGKTPEDKVIVFTYKVVVNKVDGSTGDPLTGAGFTLYKKNTSGEYTAIGEEIKGESLTTFEWKGLDDGDYRLVETTTPAGYNTMVPIEFTISAEHDIEAADPKLTKLDGGILGTGDVDTGAITKEIENNRGTVLPETGAEGTVMFITVGAILATIAAVFMITRKKMSIYED